jgi:hypothetical protein
MALIEIKVGGNAPQHTLQLLHAALEKTTLAATGSLPGTTPHIAMTHPAGAPNRPIVEVDVSGQLPDQNQADLANSCWEITRTVLRPITGHWSVTLNAPAHIRALANRSWDEDGQAHRWPEN